MVILLGFLHAWLKIRDRAKPLKEVFADVSRQVWEAYHAPDRRRFAQRLRQWAGGPLTGIVLEQVLDLCRKRARTATPAATAPAACSIARCGG